jgi:glycosyltransferase involved in cell wall biosynthesis
MDPHVIIYTDDPDKGGVANYNHQIAIGLRQAGVRVSMVQAASQSAATRQQAEAGVSHEWIAYDTGVDFMRTITDVSDAERAFDRLRPDVVLFSDCCPLSNIAAKHVAISRGLPIFIVVHFVAPYLAERFAKCLPIVGQQYAKANAVVAVSSDNLALLHRRFGLPADKGRVIFNGVSPAFFAPRDHGRGAALRREFGIPDDAVVSLTTARLTEVKGHAFQVHAMELLRVRQPKVKLVCVWAGGGELCEALQAEVAKRKLQDRIFLVGQQSNVSAWLDAADIFTLTSLIEGMPISIMEAMAKGLPVVATSISGIPEEMEKTGALLPDPQKQANATVVQLANTWAAWGRSPELRRRVGEAARRRATECFQAETMIAQVREGLESALASVQNGATKSAVS